MADLVVRRSLPSFDLPAGIPCPPDPDGTPSSHFIRHGYILVRRHTIEETRCPSYDPDAVFQSEYDVCRRLSRKHAKAMQRDWTEELTLFVDCNEHARWQLRLNLTGTDGKSHKVSYAHLVACALLKAQRDVRGRACAPHYIASKDWYRYEAVSRHFLSGSQGKHHAHQNFVVGYCQQLSIVFCLLLG
jgi:hypothetical protein